ncbi:MAG: hypothetical protein JSR26_01160 [Proteobacteria bacterium]|nr:hypothetical protein [Pseudomonadota bacterium]
MGRGLSIMVGWCEPNSAILRKVANQVATFLSRPLHPNSNNTESGTSTIEKSCPWRFISDCAADHESATVSDVGADGLNYGYQEDVLGNIIRLTTTSSRTVGHAPP